MDYITTIEMSKIWGISSRRISLLCSQGRVPGAEKKGKTWLIPKDAVKPTAVSYTHLDVYKRQTPYGVTWEEMGMKPWEDLEENE